MKEIFSAVARELKKDASTDEVTALIRKHVTRRQFLIGSGALASVQPHLAFWVRNERGCQNAAAGFCGQCDWHDRFRAKPLWILPAL